MFNKLKKYHWISIVIAFIVVNNVVAMTFSLSNEYYIVMGAALMVLLVKGGIKKVNGLYVAFAVVCLLSILFNDIPAIFRPWGRFVTFIMVTSLVSPMLQSPTLRRFRVEAFVLIQYLLLLVTIISFFATLGGYNSMRLAAGRTGITTQVMIMGPVAGISLVFCTYQLWIQKSKKLGKITKMIYLLGLFCSFAMNLMAVSRVGVAAAAAGIVALIIYKARFKAGKAMWYAGVIFVLLAGTYPLWNGYSAQVEKKNQMYIDGDGMFASRQNNWDQRIDEFKKSPWFGVGFGAVDMGDDNITDISEGGTVETGSGWLLVLSMTGIFGFVLFVLFFIKAFKKTYRMVKKEYIEPYCLMGALLALFSVHMIAEGYSLAAGGLLFFNLWLLLGVTDAWPVSKKSLSL